MKDRIATNPGRVQLVPVAGQTNVYDMTMADNPTELGTALNKANLLTDATAAAIAAAFGSTPDTPNEALALLAGSINMEIQTYVGTNTYGSDHPCSVTFAHEPKLVFIFEGQYAAAVRSAAILNYAGMGASGVFVRIHDTSTYTCNNYTITNNRKTFSWYANAADATVGVQMQMNTSGTHYVFAFY